MKTAVTGWTTVCLAAAVATPLAVGCVVSEGLSFDEQGAESADGGAGGADGGAGGSSDAGADSSKAGADGSDAGAGGTDGAGGSAGRESGGSAGESSSAGESGGAAQGGALTDGGTSTEGGMGGQAGSGGGDQECVAREYRCHEGVSERCNENAEWVTYEACSGETPVCIVSTGQCGTCSENETQCRDESTLEVCNADGAFVASACPAATPQCLAGVCEECDPGEVPCDGACIDPDTDDDHCGASGSCMGSNAGSTCSEPFSCVGGVCELVCDGPEIDCDDTCIDPDTDETYCGASSSCTGQNRGETCDTGYACEGGVCRLQCPSSQIACDGICITPETDEDYCGATSDCEGANAGAQCSPGGVCVDSACQAADGEACGVDADCISNTCTTFYEDDDGDGYGAESTGIVRACGTEPPGSGVVENNEDCCDVADVPGEAFAANPDYSGGPQTNGADGCPLPHDWDCNGVEIPLIDEGSCTDFSQGNCPEYVYSPSGPDCGIDASATVCQWNTNSNQCMGVAGVSRTQACD